MDNRGSDYLPGTLSFDDDFVVWKKPRLSSTTIMPFKNSQENKKKPFKKLIADFASSTSAHGIGKIHSSDCGVRRALWSLGCLTVYIAMFILCIQLLVRYLEKPIVSRVEVSYEENLSFPAVTICNLNMIKMSEIVKSSTIRTMMKQMGERSEKQKQAMQTNHTGNYTRQKDPFEKRIEARKSYYRKRLMRGAHSSRDQKIFAGAEVDESSVMKKMLDRSLKTIPRVNLSQMGYSLDEMVQSCRWSRFKCTQGTLREMWRHFWHWKYGNCYTFNSGKSETGESLPVLTVERAGPYDGLELLINVNQMQYHPFSDEAGVRVVLTDQDKMPFPFDEGFSIPTGFSTSVGVRKVYTRRVDPHNNNSCASQDNSASLDADDIYRKKYYVNYSIQTCRKSCLAAKQWAICNCSDTRFPSAENGSSSCTTEEQAECAADISRKFLKRGMECARKCPQPCLDNSFRYIVSSAQWSKKYTETLRKRFPKGGRGSGGGRHDVGDNFLKVVIFYEELSMEKIIYEEAYPIANLLADFGGQLGLWIGVSVLTAAEVLELVLNVFYLLVRKMRRQPERV